MIKPTPTARAIATAVAVLSVAAPAAAADDPTPIDRLVAQEAARDRDPAIVGTVRQAPAVVQVIQRPDGFDWGDAGIGGAASLALVVLAAAGAVLRHESHRQEANG